MYQLAKAVEARQPLFGMVISIILKAKLKLSDKRGRPWTVAKKIDVRKIGNQPIGFSKKAIIVQTTTKAAEKPNKKEMVKPKGKDIKKVSEVKQKQTKVTRRKFVLQTSEEETLYEICSTQPMEVEEETQFMPVDEQIEINSQRPTTLAKVE
ncbi:hypothetical protein Droror1_Dr00019872, partial [Drosera rotundifolia]